ncbi:MAG: FMN-binding negative transcriptional regulator [Burkholderiales bacterium]|nr:MAG: FMN-binding negative transcriptional regulator [Burkholderiales bacterium]
MYNPSHFDTSDDRAALLALMRAHPLGALVTHGPQGLDANHLPFEVDEAAGVLRAHVARANPLWRQVPADGMAAMVIFRGEAGYISPNWYPGKHETHRQVPTWNYRVVHVHGHLTVMDQERFVRGLVARLTRDHEKRSNQAKPWMMGDSPADYIDQMLAAIVGIEVTLQRLEGKFKLSQNKEARDRLGAADGLDALGQVDLAQRMRGLA